jgi:hypothetical protein
VETWSPLSLLLYDGYMKREPIRDGKSLERFQSLLRTVANVPKAEVEKLENKERVKNQRRREKRKTLKAA